MKQEVVLVLQAKKHQEDIVKVIFRKPISEELFFQFKRKWLGVFTEERDDFCYSLCYQKSVEIQMGKRRGVKLLRALEEFFDELGYPFFKERVEKWDGKDLVLVNVSYYFLEGALDKSELACYTCK
jgi:hypothetical protein